MKNWLRNYENFQSDKNIRFKVTLQFVHTPQRSFALKGLVGKFVYVDHF